MTEVEYAGLVLEDQVLDHLATPEGAMMFWRERVSPDLISDGDPGIAEALAFVIDYIDTYRKPPDVSVIAQETGYEDFEEPIAPAEYVIDKLRERNTRLGLKRTITKMSRMAQDPRSAVAFGMGEFSRILAEGASHRHELDSQNVDLVIDRYKSRAEDGQIGITFGYEELDKVLGGLRPGCLYFIIARPKRYKSWQLIKSATDALVEGRNITFATLEMTVEEMQDRMLCYLAGVSWSKFEHRALTAPDFAKFEEASQWLKDQPNLLRFIRPSVGERTVAHLRQDAYEHDAECLYVDQLSWIEPLRQGKRHEEIASICYDLKDAAQDFPVYCAAQFNREASNLEEMADLQHIGLSDAVGQTADMVLGTYASKEMHANKIIRLGTVASRSFENYEWEVKVELSEWCNFRVANLVEA